MRCFVAVDPPDDVRAAVAGVQEALREAAPRADVRWSDPAGFHLTLAFLGEVDDARLGAVRDVLGGVATRHAPFDMAAAGFGGFPTLERPRALWVGITTGLRAIGRLAADVERAMIPLGFPLAKHPFRGHLTIARVRSSRGVGRLVRSAASLHDRVFGDWPVGGIVLYRSHLRPGGSVYEPLDRYRLSDETP